MFKLFLIGDMNLTSKHDDLNVIELGIRRAIVNPNFRKTRKGDKQSLYFDVGIIILRVEVNIEDGFITSPTNTDLRFIQPN